MNYTYFNPNPNAKTFKSGKPKSWHIQDDSVRAICKALDKSWEESYRLLDNVAINNFTIINDKDVVDSILTDFKFKYVTHGKPKSGEKRPTIADFVETHKHGTYVAYLRDYYVTIVDGILYDVNNHDNEVVYSYWTK